MAQKRNSALIFIFITLLIDITGLGIIIPVFPKLLAGFTGSVSEAARWGGYLMFAYAAMQFVFSPIIGSLSDQFGRRPVLLASLFAFGIDYLILAFAPSLVWLFVGRIIAGITGASFSTASAYIADVSAPEDRAKNFGLIGAAFGLGFILGPTLGGHLAELGEKIPFFVAAGFALVNWLYGFFILPESLKPENRRKFDWKRSNPISSLLNFTKYPVLKSLLAAIICLYLAGQTYPSVWSYFCIKQFNWGMKDIGYSLGALGLFTAIVQGGLNRILIPKLGERKAVIIGLVCYITGFILYGMASAGWMMYVFMIPACLGGLATPALQAIISKQIPANQQGELQGTMTSLMSAASVVGPLLATNAFAYFTSDNVTPHIAGAPFFLAAGLTLISILVILRSFRKFEQV